MRFGTIRVALVACAAAMLYSGCGGGGSPATPSTPTAPTQPAKASVSVTTTTVTGTSQTTGGYTYEVVVLVRESGGLAATINSIDLTFTLSAGGTGTAHYDSPMSDASNRVLANSTAGSKRLVATDDDGSSYASTVRATVNFTDDSRNIGTATVTENIPALPAPTPTFVLSGTVMENPGGFPVVSARVEIKSGPNTGAALGTDSGGRFSFAALESGTFTIATSKAEFDTAQQTVTLSGNLNVSVNLQKSKATTPPTTPPSLCSPASASCGSATARCKDGTLSCSQNRQGTCSSHQGVSCFICPGLLCNGLTGSETEFPNFSAVPLASTLVRAIIR
jgi:hypothetical protein